MARYRLCKCCRKRFTIKRNPQQVYCSDKPCQHHRKIVWRKAKMKNDLDYRINQNAANKRWQSNNPDYWRRYRERHPEYVESNRCAQQVRDGTAPVNASHLAKSDTLTSETLMMPGTYWLTPDTEDTLAKSDSLLVKILVISTQDGNESNLAKRLLYSQ
jgi:hypothetical protein